MQFIRELILGETIVPFRLLTAIPAMIPLDGSKLLDSAEASEAGYHYLAAWLRDAEAKWAEYSNRTPDGRLVMTLSDRIDHMRNLSHQVGPAAVRVVYNKAGTRLSAARLDKHDVLVDHSAYWVTAHTAGEAAYLVGLINSAAVLAKVADLQPHGQRDKRHFDNLVWTLPIPEYDDTDPVHRDLAAAATRAEAIAAGVQLALHCEAPRYP